MKKILIVILIIIFVIIAFINDRNNKEIRLRIIPNSDEKTDLLMKEKVKDAVIYYLKEIYVEDYQMYKKNISNSLVGLEDIIDSNYTDCSLSFSYHTLYNKEYNGSALKNKNSLTLVVILGDGKGGNWWGSIYPEYLGIEGDDVVEYESLFVNLIKYIKRKDE